MNEASVAPCGVICDICLGFQRTTKNKCVGCNSIGNKPYHCTVCSIKDCPEKNGDAKLLCGDCSKFPCRRIKDLDKRYTKKYGESPVQNLRKISKIGLSAFIQQEKKKWVCPKCGGVLCVHRNACQACGEENRYFPRQECID